MDLYCCSELLLGCGPLVDIDVSEILTTSSLTLGRLTPIGARVGAPIGARVGASAIGKSNNI